MIEKIANLPEFRVENMSLAKIYCQYHGFKDSALENSFYKQEIDGRITALISTDGGSMNIYCDNPDYSELREFLQVLKPSVIFTEYENAKPLGLKTHRVRNMLHIKTEKTAEFVTDFTLKQLYDTLDFGSDVDIHLPSFEVFAPDVSHRLRHSGAVAVVKEEGAALCFTYDGGAAMTGIALSPLSRGKGLGKKLLLELLSLTDGDFFVAANDINKEFYLRNGFELWGSVCFGSLE